MTDTATYLGANGWLLNLAGLRVLLDPWLTGPLVFPPGAWLLKGELPRPMPIPDSLDLLLLTQGLPDHAHPETLQALSKQIPVVASAAAARVVQGLGFEAITELQPGDTTTISGLTIQATAGAAVPAVENGYLLDWCDGSLYLEPHGVLDPSIDQRSVDTLITPVVDLGLPVLGAFITGARVMPELIGRFQPKTVLASTTGGDVKFSGMISSLLNAADASSDCGDLPENCALITPTVGREIPLPSGSR